MFDKISGAALALALLAGAAQAQDAAEGEKVFRKCRACHVIEDGKNRVGPHLYQVFGREVAAVDGFRYSSAMEAWGEGKVWDDALMAEYLEKPRSVVKGTKMAFAGLRKAEDIANVIAYIKAESGE